MAKQQEVILSWSSTRFGITTFFTTINGQLVYRGPKPSWERTKDSDKDYIGPDPYHFPIVVPERSPDRVVFAWEQALLNLNE